MTFLGLAALVVLSLLAVVAAAAVAVRAEYVARAEQAVAMTYLTNAIVLVPIYVLATTGHLTPVSLGITSALFSSALIAAAARVRPRVPVPVFARQVVSALVSALRLPFDGLRAAWRVRSVVFLGLLFAFGIACWTAITAYYVPAWREWDALWYHEPIVSFTIQNHGFRIVPLPLTGLQKINGYPRVVEMTQLWFVIFTDRRLIEIANSFIAPGLILVTYLLARRLSGERVTSMGWGAAIVILPATSYLLRTTYVDIHCAFLVLGAAHFGTREDLRLRDLLLTALILAMAVGAKVLMLAPVGVLSLIVLWRVFRGPFRKRAWPTLAALAGGIALMSTVAALTYWRNWKAFGNPFWPDLIYDNPRFGIHWTGVPNGIPPSQSFSTLLDNITSIPYSRSMSHFDHIWEYGFVSGWYFFPLVAATLLLVVVVIARAAIGRVAGVVAWRLTPRTVTAIQLAILIIGGLWIRPTGLYDARYYIGEVALAMAIVGWGCTQLRLHRLYRETAATVLVCLSIQFFWTPRWWHWPSELMKVAKIPYPEREVTPASAISPTLDYHSGSPITRDVGLARERELGRGKVLAFSDSDGIYISIYWNNDISNKVVYVPAGPDFLERVDQAGATWLYCNHHDPMYSRLRAAGSGWSEIGTIDMEGWGSVFRRAR